MNSDTSTHRVNRHGGPALEHMFQLVKWLVPTLEKFPRTQRFLLGDRIQAAALDALEGLTTATYQRSPARELAQVNSHLDRLRVLCRLAFELQYLDLRRYEFSARAIDEVGRLAGGWRKALSGDGGST